MKKYSYIVIVISTINFLYRLNNPSFEYSFSIFILLYSYLLVRKGIIYKNMKKMFNVDIWKIEFKGVGNFIELLLIVEAYFCTDQFNNGILNGLTSNFSENMMFSLIPCLLLYRFALYRSIELSY